MLRYTLTLLIVSTSLILGGSDGVAFAYEIVAPARFEVGGTVAVAVSGSFSGPVSFSVTDLGGTEVDTESGSLVGGSYVAEFIGLLPGVYVVTSTDSSSAKASSLIVVERRDVSPSSKADVTRLGRSLEMNFSERRKFDERQRDEKRSPP